MRRFQRFPCGAAGLALALVLACAAPAALGDVGVVAGSEALTIEFAIPARWRCEAQRPCTVCRNLGPDASDVLVRRPGRGAEVLRLPVGAALSVCPPVDRVAGGSPAVFAPPRRVAYKAGIDA